MLVLKEDFENLDKVLKNLIFKFICIDVANGYTEHFTNFIKSVRDKYPTETIIAGNVVTADMTQELVLSGADIIKVNRSWKCMYNKNSNRCRLSTIKRRDGVC